MYIPFEQMPEHARVWIYQSDRQLSTTEVSEISAMLKGFTDNWVAHGKNLKASFQLPYNQFIIIAADQEFHQPTGCSIDASVAIIRQIEQQFGISLFDRMSIAFKQEEAVKTVKMNEIKKLAGVGTLSNESITFNNLVENVGQLATNWELPAKETWLSRYFPN